MDSIPIVPTFFWQKACMKHSIRTEKKRDVLELNQRPIGNRLLYHWANAPTHSGNLFAVPTSILVRVVKALDLIPCASACSTIWATHIPCSLAGFKSRHGKFFANLPDCHPPSKIMPIFQKMSFCPSNSETQTFRHVQCAEPWRLEWCVPIPEAVTQETNFLIPKIHCLNKLRGESRTGIDCVSFCACESAVSRWDSCIFTTTLARARGRPIPRIRACQA